MSTLPVAERRELYVKAIRWRNRNHASNRKTAKKFNIGERTLARVLERHAKGQDLTGYPRVRRDDEPLLLDVAGNIEALDRTSIKPRKPLPELPAQSSARVIWSSL